MERNRFLRSSLPANNQGKLLAPTTVTENAHREQVIVTRILSCHCGDKKQTIKHTLTIWWMGCCWHGWGGNTVTPTMPWMLTTAHYPLAKTPAKAQVKMIETFSLPLSQCSTLCASLGHAISLFTKRLIKNNLLKIIIIIILIMITTTSSCSTCTSHGFE